jgi:uncharacterized membrane protein YeaQ/YmgE (transglycosylase-associated protein family)
LRQVLPEGGNLALQQGKSGPAAVWHAVCPKALRGPPALTSKPTGETNMNLIIWLVVGGLIGWVASMIMRTDGQQGVILNVIVGIVGAMLGGWLISPLVGVPTINQDAFSIGALAVSLLGAVILLAIVNFFRRGTAR